jgi:hypothetical protein
MVAGICYTPYPLFEIQDFELYDPRLKFIKDIEKFIKAFPQRYTTAVSEQILNILKLKSDNYFSINFFNR